jgi:hypothetical protein
VVFLRIDAATVEIVVVAHAKRRPGYWLDRALELMINSCELVVCVRI